MLSSTVDVKKMIRYFPKVIRTFLNAGCSSKLCTASTQLPEIAYGFMRRLRTKRFDFAS